MPLAGVVWSVQAVTEEYTPPGTLAAVVWGLDGVYAAEHTGSGADANPMQADSGVGTFTEGEPADPALEGVVWDVQGVYEEDAGAIPLKAVLWEVYGVTESAIEHTGAGSDANPMQVDSGAGSFVVPQFTGDAADANPMQVDAGAGAFVPHFSAAGTDANPMQSDAAAGTHTEPEITGSGTDANPMQVDTALGVHASILFDGGASEANPMQVDSAQGTFTELSLPPLETVRLPLRFARVIRLPLEF